MRSRLLLCLVVMAILLSAVPSLAQSPIPVYPGSKAEFELNLTQQDFLPVLRQWISIIPSAAGAFIAAPGSGMAGNEDAREMIALGEQVAKEVQAVFAGVNQVSVVGYQQPKDVPFEKIADFYVREVGLDKGWTRTLLAQHPEGSAMLYVRPNLTAMFAVGMGGGYVGASKIEGKIDLVALGEIIAKYAPLVMSRMNMGGGGSVETPEPGETTQPADGGGCQVILNDVGPQRVRVLGYIREMTGMTPTEAREFVQCLPQPLLTNISQQTADLAVATLQSMGAKAEAKPME